MQGEAIHSECGQLGVECALRLERFRERCVQSMRTLQISTRDPVANVTVVSGWLYRVFLNDVFLMAPSDS